VETISPAPEQSPKKRGFFGWLFSSKPKPTPVPATPAPTPAPTKKVSAEPKKPEQPVQRPATEQEPKPRKTQPTPKPVAKKAVKSVEDDSAEKERFNAAKKKAIEVERIRELKAVADNAMGEDEGRKALRTYNKALYEEMRKIDPEITDRINQIEAAIMRRLAD
jgi:outer membrane biosynthesis protein TonB